MYSLKKTLFFCFIFILSLIIYSCKSRQLRVSKSISIGSPQFLKSVESISNHDFKKGNLVKILPTGKETFQTLFKILKEAKHSIHIETFFYGNDSTGTKITNILIRKAQEGVSIRLIVDSWGGGSRIERYEKVLKKVGVELYFYNPNKFYNLPTTYHIRNHRRLIIVDGKKAITGGFGLTAWWYSYRMEKSFVTDTQIYIQGESVTNMQKIFADSWYRISGEILTGLGVYSPMQDYTGNVLVAPVGSEPNKGYNKFYRIFLLAIRSSRKEILITTPYFLPDKVFIEELKKALKRGVHIELLLPDPKFVTEFPVVHASKRHYPELIKMGMKVFHYKKRMLHAKRVVFDKQFGIVGSSNLDYRSLLINEEVDFMVYDKNIAQSLVTLHKNEKMYAKEISLEDSLDRNCFMKGFERFWILWEFLM